MTNKINNQILDEKHNKYFKVYKPNDLFWGIGIENELYLELNKKRNASKNFILNFHKRERYSVDYFSNYKQGVITELLKSYLDNRRKINIPILVNSHTLSKTDINNEHMTMYTRLIKVNPKFNGKTIQDELIENDKYFSDCKNYIFDGDIIEIMTFNFYKATINTSIQELKQNKQEYIEHLQNCQNKLNLFPKYGKISWMKKNHPLACYLTNYYNLAIFCNGTLHYNITLPTKLNDKAQIENMTEFIDKHRILIRLIQFFEPFLIAIYGTPDPFHRYNKNVSCVSQRCAISRYIGILTYDSDTMLTGKLLQIDANKFPDYFWYHKYYKYCDYTKRDQIGYDINFNKYMNHGIEIRFFEHMQESKILESLSFICLLADLALDLYDDNQNIANPINIPLLHDFICDIHTNGTNTIVNIELFNLYKEFISDIVYYEHITDFFNQIYSNLSHKYLNSKNGKFTKLVIPN